MIISCTNCSKKFEVDTQLIPDSGRNVQCGSCNHVWHFEYNVEVISKTLSKVSKEEKIDIIKTIDENSVEKRDEINPSGENKENDQDFSKTDKYFTTSKEKKSFFNLSRILSSFIVVIFTFIAFVIILDTFKIPLNNIFPDLELILYNLFETIKDIFLFLKNLFI